MTRVIWINGLPYRAEYFEAQLATSSPARPPAVDKKAA